jgi:GTP-binding protein
VLALAKSDLVSDEEVRRAIAEWRGRLGAEVAVIATSSATGAGLRELSNELLRRVAPAESSAHGGAREERPDAFTQATGAGGASSPAGPEPASGERPGGEEGFEGLAEHMVFRPAAGSGFRVERVGPRSFAVRGRGIEQLLARYDVENDEAMAYLEERLRRIGVLKALEAEGFKPGDEIEIAGVTFELDPSAAA